MALVSEMILLIWKLVWETTRVSWYLPVTPESSVSPDPLHRHTTSTTMREQLGDLSRHDHSSYVPLRGSLREKNISIPFHLSSFPPIFSLPSYPSIFSPPLPPSQYFFYPSFPSSSWWLSVFQDYSPIASTVMIELFATMKYVHCLKIDSGEPFSLLHNK